MPARKPRATAAASTTTRTSAFTNMPESQTPAARKARGEKTTSTPAVARPSSPMEKLAEARKNKRAANPAPVKATSVRKPRAKATPAKPAPVPFVEVVPMSRCQESTKHERKTYKCDDLSGTDHEHYAWVNDATMLTWGER